MPPISCLKPRNRACCKQWVKKQSLLKSRILKHIGYIRWVVYIIFVSLSVGCVANMPTPPPECVKMCKKSYIICCESCQNSCVQCVAKAHANASERYQHYKKNQCIQGNIMPLELQSFRDPLKCRKTTCACLKDYQVCYQACTGVINKSLQVPRSCS